MNRLESASDVVQADRRHLSEGAGYCKTIIAEARRELSAPVVEWASEGGTALLALPSVEGT